MPDTTPNTTTAIGPERADRDASNGRFVVGNKAATVHKRRKRARGVAALMRAIENAVTPHKADELVASALVQLQKGNVGPFTALVNAARMAKTDEWEARLDELEKRLDSAHAPGVAGRVGTRAA